MFIQEKFTQEHTKFLPKAKNNNNIQRCKKNTHKSYNEEKCLNMSVLGKFITSNN